MTKTRHGVGAAAWDNFTLNACNEFGITYAKIMRNKKIKKKALPME